MSRDKRQAFTDYLEHIQAIYVEYGLINVTEEGDYWQTLAEHVGHLKPHYNQCGQIDYQYQDLLHIVLETRFAVANVLLLVKIGLTDFQIKETKQGPVPQFFRNVVDFRFFYFVDDVFMRLYNFWNRVANFLNLFFQIEKNAKQVYFAPRFMNKLAARVGTDPNFQNLRNFRDGDYKDMINRRRRKTVHRESSSRTYFESSIRNSEKLDELSKLQQERDELPEFFLASYRRMIHGLDEMLALIKRHVK